MSADVVPEKDDFFAGGGQMGALMRAHDWSTSPLGPPDAWPQSLRSVVGLLLTSKFPMFVAWGKELGFLYNDSYADILGAKHPKALGARFHEIWSEIWPDISPLIAAALAGQATYREDLPLLMNRKGFDEQTWFTFSYSPVRDESGAVAGMFCACTETTGTVLAQRRQVEEKQRLEQLFDQAPGFMAMLRGPEHIFEMCNPAYMRLIGGRDVLGKAVAEALPEVVEQGYGKLLDDVYSSGKAFSSSGAKFSMQSTPGGPITEHYLNFVYQPVKDASGQVTGVFVEGSDITATHRATEDLRTANEALQMNAVERAHSEARYRSALMAGRLVHWETDLTTGTRIWSRDAMELFGISLPDGRGHFGGSDDEFRAAVHPDDRHIVPTFYQLADKQDWFPVEYRIQRPDGSVRWVSGGGQVIARGSDGKARRLVNVVNDITERKIGEEHVHSLLAEITHRGKNLLAVIQAIASQTGRTTVSFEEFQERFTRRLHGLAASHDLLVMQNWRGASLTNLVRNQLAPFAEWDSGAIRASGPDIYLNPKITETLGMALHELATNAVKYGSLSVPEGKIDISWQMENAAGASPERLKMSWVERGGPTVAPPSRKGFGHTVFERIVAKTLNGDLALDFAPEGLDWQLSIPAMDLNDSRAVYRDRFEMESNR